MAVDGAISLDPLSGELERAERGLRLLLTTQLGTVAQDPEFGIDWLEVIDQPWQEAQALVVFRVASAIARWLPKVTLERVEVSEGDDGAHHRHVRVRWRLGSSAPRTTEVTT